MGKDKDKSVLDVAEPPRPRSGKFRVSLAAATPLAKSELVVDAKSSDEAWQKFCEANGISGSDCPREIQELPV